MNVIKKTAKMHDVSEKEVQQEIASAISAAKENPSTRETWQKLFPSGKKPTPEEFILTIAKFIRENGAI